MKNLVSVIIPVYNAELYILKAVESIIQQTYRNIEIIITDDCSTDNSFQILQAIKDNRIKLYRNEKNSGVSFTLNNCILKTKGDLIAVMHADDIADADRIKLQKEYLDTHPEIAVIGSSCVTIDKNDDFINPYSVATDTNVLLLETLLKKIPFPHPTVMYRREVVLEVGLYKSAYDGMEDHDMWLRLAAAGYKFGNISKPLLKYRIHASQISNNFKDVDIIKNYSIFYDYVKTVGMNRSYEEVVKYSNICNKGFYDSSSQEFSFLLQFLTEILNHQKFLSTIEIGLIKKKLIMKVLKSMSKKSADSYLVFFQLFKWFLTHK